MKQTILDHIDNETFSEWHLEAQENGEIAKDELRDLVDQLVESDEVPQYIHTYSGDHILIHFV